MSIRMELVNRMVDLVRKRNALEIELKQVKAEIEKLHKPILEDISRAGVKNIPLTDGATLVPRRDVFLSKRKGIPMAVACQLLRDAGLTSYVNEKYSTGLLKGWIREQEQEHGISDDGPASHLPENLKDVFNCFAKTSVVVLRAGEEDPGEFEKGVEEDNAEESDLGKW